jgi:hypothetical protein
VKITAEAVAAVFDGGRLELQRREAVTALCARCGCSVCGAYTALSAAGNFGAHIREADSVLSWQLFLLVSTESNNHFIPFPTASEPEKLLALKS